jgi:hypothetical protein
MRTTDSMRSAAERGPGAGAAFTITGPPGPRAARRRLVRLILHAVFGVIGVSTLALLIRSVGARSLVQILGRSAHWLPLLIALDLLRIAGEALGTSLLSRPFRRLPAGSLARIHLIAFAICSIMPAGRAASEAAKGTMLARSLGAPRAAAIAATSQSLALLSGAAIALPCVAAAYQRTGPSAFTGALTLYALTSGAGFALMQLACRRREIGGFFGRRFARIRAATASFHDAVADIPVLPPGTLLLMVGGRAIQALEFGILIYAVGAAFGLEPALLGQGVNLLGSTAGDLVPGQFGATDAAFAIAAPTLGISAASAVSIAVMAHCVQLFWALLGALIPLFWRERAGEESAPESSPDLSPT